jgi:hypothetical protein
MANARNARKKPSGPSAATNPKPPAVTATAHKAASKKKKGNQVSSGENYPHNPSDDSNADDLHDADNAGEPLPGRQNTRHRGDVGMRELMEKYTEMQGE